MNGLISTLPVSPPPLVESPKSNSGSVVAVRAPSVIPLTAPVVASGCPAESTRVNDPVSTKPPLWLGAVAGTKLSVTGPTKAPAGMPVPVTGRPLSVATTALSAIVETPAAAEQAGAGRLGRNRLRDAVGRAVDERVVAGTGVQRLPVGAPQQRRIGAGGLEVDTAAE